MKLTKQLRQDIETAIHFISKAQKYIERHDIEICTRNLPNNQSYRNPQGEALSPLMKFTGSDLMNLINAKDRLNSLLDQDNVNLQNSGK